MNLLPPASDDVAARQAHPYAVLTPDVVMDALSSVGLQGDGRLTALSSYENRVYQVHLEDPHDGHGAVSYTHLDVYKRQPLRRACARS